MKNYQTKYQNSLAKEIKELEITLQIEYSKLKHTFDDEAWHEKVSLINSLRIDIQTKKSRIENFGKDAYMPTKYVIPNQNK